MKSQKGITLTSLVIYIMVATIVIGILAIVGTNFARNVRELKNQQMYAPEFNQFAMYFLQDVKSNQTATVTTNTVIFANGAEYRYDSSAKKVYRNDIEIASKISRLSFILDHTTVGNTQKNIIQVAFQSGEFSKTIRFVLRYW